MADIDDFMPDVLIFAPDCPDLVVYKHLRDVARDFCTVTRLWTTTDTMTISAPECEGIPNYPDVDVIEILHASLDGHDLDPRTPGWLDDNVFNWANLEGGGCAQYITQLKPGVLTIVPKVTGTLTARMVLQPSRDAMEFPDFLLERHATLIGRGAAGRALMMPNEPYTNPQLGTVHWQEYLNERPTQKMKAARGQHRGKLHTKGRYF